MATFAKIGLNSKVIEVLSVHNNELKDSNGVEQENIGIDFLTKLTGWSIWVQTSYNTHGGVHDNDGTPLRKKDYGTWESQLEKIYDNGIDSWKADITSVKTKFPKKHN